MKNTLRKSRSSSAKPFRTAKKAVDAPFDPDLLRRAEAIAGDYRLILEHSPELGYIGTAVEMPTVFADGRTPDECVKATRQALAVAVATMLERGQRPPASRGKRTMQVNVRLTPDEKLALEEAASQLGYQGISDFLRAAGLDRTHAA